jgi:hypothetical protein
MLNEHQSRTHNRIQSSSLVLRVIRILQELDVLQELEGL